MQVPEYPKRKCREAFWDELMAHNCDLEQYHYGPCASLSSASSVKYRDEWEEKNPTLATEKRDNDIIM